MTDAPHLPVRKVAELTGIPATTLRMWEHRYGRPCPLRSSGGQRRYRPEDVELLRLVAQGMRAGHRPGRLLRSTDLELRQLVEAAREQESGEYRPLMEAVLHARYDELYDAIVKAAEERSMAELMDQVVGPFLMALGIAWAEGRIEVRHEHVAVNVVRDALAFLRMRFPRAAAARSRRFALGTLPGERHELGVTMLSVVLAEHDQSYANLGAELSPIEIADGARELEAHVACLSISIAHAGVETDRKLAELREHLPQATELWIGGNGAQQRRRPLEGMRTLSDMAAVAQALDELDSLT